VIEVRQALVIGGFLPQSDIGRLEAEAPVGRGRKNRQMATIYSKPRCPPLALFALGSLRRCYYTHFMNEKAEANEVSKLSGRAWA
jgi:hypothetical protein